MTSTPTPVDELHQVDEARFRILLSYHYFKRADLAEQIRRHFGRDTDQR